MKKQQTAARVAIYLGGMVLLALGITLNTKAGLGASAIVSVPYTISRGTGLDLLQVVVSIVFTRFLSLFQTGIRYASGFLPTDLLVLALGILFTGVGAAMTVDMQLIPNPGDGIVSSLADRFHKELGLCKNCFDAFCVVCSLVIGLCFGDLLLGVGLGTVLSMVGVGRVIWFFNHLAKARLQQWAGLAK